MQRLQATRMVDGCPRSGKPIKTKYREDIWNCFSINCKLYLVPRWRCIPRQRGYDTYCIMFDIHPLADRPIFMEDSARVRIVIEFRKRKTHSSCMSCPLIWTQWGTYGTLFAVKWTNAIHNVIYCWINQINSRRMAAMTIRETSSHSSWNE